MSTPSSAAGLGRAGLIILLAGQLLPMIDFSIVNVGLDAMAQSLHASPTQLELIVAVYGVAFAVCLAMGSRMGDNLGRRRLFLWGVRLFAVASLMCGLANSVWLLLVARTLQGVGAAMIVPQIMATIHVCLRGREHARAMALYGGIGGLAFIIGQVLGGLLISLNIAGYGWRSVFLINIPLCALVLACAHRWVPDTRAERPVSIDWPGTLLLALTIVCLLFPLALGPVWHWPWPCLALLALSGPLLLQLWRVELRQERRNNFPLLPPALLRLASVRFGLTIAILFFSCWSGFMFVMALTLQAGAQLNAFQSGNAFIALGVAYFISSLLSSTVIEHIGKVRALLLGCLIQIGGLLALMLTMLLVWPQPGILNLIPATLLIGAGQALIVSGFFRIGLADVPVEHAGSGSALLATVQQTSLGLGPILLGTVLVQVLHVSPGDYLHALLAALALELLLMLALLLRTGLALRADRRLAAAGQPSRS
ncbi:High-copy suppressor of rspA [Serratia rubidaea]|uniref:High-copy suppressor of rspA n=2 Tax=Serratia rubidaea TaxID=61652 RepID=A0A4U9HD47_SERRU|nr:MFS transporter [Serratia rubidaea]QPR65355.1 MFS transporter [Serratia rubidaea]CAI0902256.1 High-copy suppressor of rspA [Serratia rubidaea]CAI1708197.1 High-copy suppressor of rspA [Serratia rubidaea]VTP60049.1 High-copy suppressor of rspA [Serratia rubidaea]HAY0637344.1 MFS transporter [Serratia rubidaea]